MSNDDWMDIEDAVKHLMKVTGKTRRQAKHVLAEYARQGKLATSGINPETGERELIPPEAWPAVN